MRTLKGIVSLGYAGADIEFEFEVPDNATEETIEKACWEAGYEYVNCWWEEGAE